MRYFLSQYNRFYAFVIHQRLRTLYAITFIMSVLITTTWFFGCYLFFSHKIEAAQQSLCKRQSFFACAHKDQKQCCSLEGEINALKKKLQNIQPYHMNSAQLLESIMQAADHVGILLRDCTLGTQRKQEKEAAQIIECSFSATFDQVIGFFDYLCVQKTPVECTHLDMQGTGVYEVRCEVQAKESPFRLR